MNTQPDQTPTFEEDVAFLLGEKNRGAIDDYALAFNLNRRYQVALQKAEREVRIDELQRFFATSLELDYTYTRDIPTAEVKSRIAQLTDTNNKETPDERTN